MPPLPAQYSILAHVTATVAPQVSANRFDDASLQLGTLCHSAPMAEAAIQSTNESSKNDSPSDSDANNGILGKLRVTLHSIRDARNVAGNSLCVASSRCCGSGSSSAGGGPAA